MRIFARAKLPSLAFKHWWPDDTERGVVVQKATFSFDAGGHCDYLAEQPPILFKDEFSGAVNESSLLTESEIAPFKPRTDIFVQAMARAPRGEPVEEWRVSLAIPDRLHYGFNVCGPRNWEREGKYWRLTKPQPISELPLVYEFAYGGMAPDAEGVPQPYEYNPAGKGFFVDSGQKGMLTIPAPQIGLLAEFMQGAPEPMTVCGFGPVGRTWLPRRVLAGTFDESWQRSRHPRMPLDYDFAFWNAALPSLQLAPYLTGNETIILNGLQINSEPLAIALPHLEGVFRLKRSGTEPDAPVPMVLDTVAINVVSEDRAMHRCTLIWRGNFMYPDNVEAVETTLREIGKGA